ncbi:hypothetical protein CBL_08188 [Carabus blaptoides fortunei]
MASSHYYYIGLPKPRRETEHPEKAHTIARQRFARGKPQRGQNTGALRESQAELSAILKQGLEESKEKPEKVLPTHSHFHAGSKSTAASDWSRKIDRLALERETDELAKVLVRTECSRSAVLCIVTIPRTINRVSLGKEITADDNVEKINDWMDGGAERHIYNTRPLGMRDKSRLKSCNNEAIRVEASAIWCGRRVKCCIIYEVQIGNAMNITSKAVIRRRDISNDIYVVESLPPLDVLSYCVFTPDLNRNYSYNVDNHHEYSV